MTATRVQPGGRPESPALTGRKDPMVDRLPAKISTLLFAFAVLAAAGAAQAMRRDVSPVGIPCVSGGVGKEEVAEMRQLRGRYDFWLVLAAKGSGAHLADVRVRVLRLPDRLLMLDHVTDGPWLLANLPEGEYELHTHYPDVRPGTSPDQRRSFRIDASGQRQIVVYYDVPDEVGP